jgi:hypothetical protein
MIYSNTDAPQAAYLQVHGGAQLAALWANEDFITLSSLI